MPVASSVASATQPARIHLGRSEDGADVYVAPTWIEKSRSWQDRGTSAFVPPLWALKRAAEENKANAKLVYVIVDASAT
eukprot:4534008-Alexandrium_andersonii.AAC.1